MNDIDIGDHVICIDARFPIGIEKLYTTLPAQDGHYVIRDIRLGIRLDCATGDASVLLVGITNPRSEGRSKIERGFSIERFRKLDELKASKEETTGKEEKKKTPEEVHA